MSPRSAPSASRWAVGVLVAALLVIVGALSLLAYQRTAPRQADSVSIQVPSFQLGESVAPATQSPFPIAGQTAATPPPAIPGEAERFLSVGTGAMWRGVAGSCGGDEASLERSTDGGATWVDVLPRYLSVGRLSALQAFAGTEAEVVASVGNACETQGLRTYTQGQFWEPYLDVLATFRYIDPADAGSVLIPGGVIDAPCADARSLRAQGDLVALVCDRRAWVRTGEMWDALPAGDVVALDVAGDDIVIAHDLASSCDGVAVTRYVAAAPSGAVVEGCVADADASAPAAIAVLDAVFIWSGDTVLRL